VSTFPWATVSISVINEMPGLMTDSLLQEVIESTGPFPLPDADAISRMSQAEQQALYKRQQEIIAIFRERALLHLASLRHRLLQLNREVGNLERANAQAPIRPQPAIPSDARIRPQKVDPDQGDCHAGVPQRRPAAQDPAVAVLQIKTVTIRKFLSVPRHMQSKVQPLTSLFQNACRVDTCSFF
jgi:hypothetical protein